MPERSPVYLEIGRRWVFACARDWPGWCRRAKGEQAAMDALEEYAPRYRDAVGPGFDVGAVEVIGRIDGNATTDFGAPAMVGPWDAEPLPVGELERQRLILQMTWRAFDAAAASAPPLLRTGPRGGGRDRDAIVRHVMEVERAYAPKVGVRIPARTPWEEQRASVTAAFMDGATGGRWPPRYALRRLAWHVLDHAWEIEDRCGR